MTPRICQFLANAAFLKINKKVCIFQSTTVFNVCVVAFKYDGNSDHVWVNYTSFDGCKSLARPTKDIRHYILTSPMKEKLKKENKQNVCWTVHPKCPHCAKIHHPLK